MSPDLAFDGAALVPPELGAVARFAMMSWVMSYTVDIVSAPPPRSYEAALDLRDQLTDERDARVRGETGSPFEAPSEEMRELHRRLIARFPCICDAPEGPWSDGPLLNNFGQRAATLGLSFSRVEEVLPFLIATALDMGFWVGNHSRRDT